MKSVKWSVFAEVAIIAGVLFSPFSKMYAENVFSDEDEQKASVVATDIYTLEMYLQVPQVLDNTTSQGSRKYKRQKIKGNMYVVWLDNGSYELLFENLVNTKFKVGGKEVTYAGYEGYASIPRSYTYIGSNKSGKFKTPCMSFHLELEPSYAIGGNNEDNSFYLQLSGSGGSTISSSTGGYRVAKRISGYCAGTQGCGCSAYSHLSPTRTASKEGPSCNATDIVATWGTWRARWKGRVSGSGCWE